jgi:hypothetical protein
MQSLDPAFLDRLTLTTAHGSTLRALGEHRGEQELYNGRLAWQDGAATGVQAGRTLIRQKP